MYSKKRKSNKVGPAHEMYNILYPFLTIIYSSILDVFIYRMGGTRNMFDHEISGTKKFKTI